MTDPKSMYTPMRGFVPGEMLCPIHEWCPQRTACAVANECKTALDRAAAQDAAHQPPAPDFNAMINALKTASTGTKRQLARAKLLDAIEALRARAEAAKARVRELEATLNTPELHDFSAAVVREAAHQRERWGSRHDAGKTDADWFWLIGYLAGKALHNPPNDMPPTEARLHRIVTVAAAAANWHAAVSGASNVMRPGIEPPAALAQAGNDGR